MNIIQPRLTYHAQHYTNNACTCAHLHEHFHEITISYVRKHITLLNTIAMFFFTVEPDCNRCNYTNGQIWLQDSRDCHKYYICVKINTWAGQWYWTNHHVSCGNLYWDMSKLTCTRTISPGCVDQDAVTKTPEDDTHCKQSSK